MNKYVIPDFFSHSPTADDERRSVNYTFTEKYKPEPNRDCKPASCVNYPGNIAVQSALFREKSLIPGSQVINLLFPVRIF